MNNDPKDRTRVITFDEKAHIDIAKGVETMRKAVGSTYGPGGRNVLIKKKYVAPVLTRDGVTVARDIAGHGNKLPNQNATEAAKLVYQASEKTNKTAGDGTTATVVLLAELYKAGYRRAVAGEDAMVIKRALDKDRDTILEFVKSKSVECTKDKLDQVAYISSGDKALGAMISDLVYDVGADGAITISYHNAPHVEVEKVTGYLFNQGFRQLQGELEFESPIVFVTQKRLATKAEMIPILEVIAQNNKQAIIVGDVAGAAMDTLLWAIQNQKADAIVIPPPAFGNDGHEYFEDIAIYTGARLWLEGDSFKDVSIADFGNIKGARVSQQKAILFGDTTRVVNQSDIDKHEENIKYAEARLEQLKVAELNRDKRVAECTNEIKRLKKITIRPITTADVISDRIKLIKDQLAASDVTPTIKETLEQRYAKLAGKVSIIKVGAATEVEREELFFRVEDAVEACKSALSSGIVAGGATTLLFASSLRKDTKKQEPVLESFVKEALQEPFRLLMSNSAEDGGYRLNQVLQAGYGHGFDLRNMSDTTIDLIDAGIVDATKVVLQTVKNAFSVAGALLTTGTIISETDDETTRKA